MTLEFWKQYYIFKKHWKLSVTINLSHKLNVWLSALRFTFGTSGCASVSVPSPWRIQWSQVMNRQLWRWDRWMRFCFQKFNKKFWKGLKENIWLYHYDCIRWCKKKSVTMQMNVIFNHFIIHVQQEQNWVLHY